MSTDVHNIPINPNEKSHIDVDSVTIRFAGDSGDGMQIMGTQFTDASAIFGNDLATMPDFPAEIRAPAGTVAGVSAYQIHFSSLEIKTPGDDLNVLVAMNAAALKIARRMESTRDSRHPDARQRTIERSISTWW